MPARMTVNVSALVDLPSALQSLAATRRTAVLQVHGDGETRCVHFANGSIVAIGGGSVATFMRAIGWSRLLPMSKVASIFAALGPQPTAEALWERVCQTTGLPPTAVKEPLSLFIEQEMETVFGWSNPQFDVVDQAPSDPLVEFQRRWEISLSVHALLLEVLRRQDERVQYRELIPDAWDVLMRSESSVAVSGDDERTVLTECFRPVIYARLLDRLPLPPFRAQRAIATLRRAGLLRLATANEIVHFGEQALKQGRGEEAHGLWLRAVALGHDGWRIRLQLADLAERLGRRSEAAEHCLRAARHASAPADQVAQLERALQLGAAPDAVLGQLVSLYLVLGNDTQALKSLLDLVRWHEERGEIARAMEVLSEARQLGADAVVTGLAIARLAAALGDTARAALQYEQAAHAAANSGRFAEAMQGWRALLALQPERLDIARALAERLAGEGAKDEAGSILHQALKRAAQLPEDAQLPAWEFLAHIDPGNTEAHDWLARVYARRLDRKRATHQLRLIANRQEQAGEDVALIATLERIIVLGGEDVDTLRRLAAAQERQGRIEAAIDAWCRAVDLAFTAGELELVQQILQEAVPKAPFSAILHMHAAHFAMRAGDQPSAVRALWRAAHLAQGSCDWALAKRVLADLIALCPDDIVLRWHVVEVLQESRDQEAKAAISEAVRLAVRRADYSLAVDLIRQLIAYVEGEERFAVRATLVDVLRRAGNATEERVAARDLLDDLLAAGELERAIELLSSLVVAHPHDPDYALQLAEATAGLGDRRTAVRCYRHAVTLLQAENRLDEARAALNQLAACSGDRLLIEAARQCLETGETIEWERLRERIARQQRQSLVNHLATGVSQ